MGRASPPPPLLLLLLFLLSLSCSRANRVYVHPFNLFALPNVTCVTLQAPEATPLETVALSPLGGGAGGGGGGGGSPEPDARDPGDLDGPRQNVTQRTAVLAHLINVLGIRMYGHLSGRQKGGNTLFSPVNAFGSLVTFYLGASRRTAIPYLQMLGLNNEKDRADCVSLVDGHKVLRTLQSINSLVDGDAKDEIDTRVWAFVRRDARVAEGFVRGTKDFSDASYVRAVDFSRGAQEAEERVNAFVEKTSGGGVKDVFKGLGAETDMLFVSSVQFKGNWRTAFQPEKTSMQEFHVDEQTSVPVPLMTHTGRYLHLNDEGRRCTVLKLALSKRTYMLLVLPHAGAGLDDLIAKIDVHVISTWYQHLREGLLELSLPKFSMAALNDLRALMKVVYLQEFKRLLGSEAEFTRLTDKKPFSIDQVYNKVAFEMSEEGAESHDRTAEGEEGGGVPLPLTFNRPFFFAVVEGNSNAILMLGKVTNPTL